MILSWIGVALGLAGVLVGQVLEGGHISSLLQPTAALIVFGGTLGATLLASTTQEFSGALRSVVKIFFRRTPDFTPLIKEIVTIASSARREGILSLEKFVPNIKSPFFANNLRHVIDGYDPAVLKDMMEEFVMHEEEEKVRVAKVWETAGGFAPTIGILGAVMGLIHVMEGLSDLGSGGGMGKLGEGIATAFVATVYGVGGANLFLIPMGNKLKKIAGEEVLELRIIADGLLGIQAGLNPRVIEDRLYNLIGEHAVEDKGGGGAAAEKKAA